GGGGGASPLPARLDLWQSAGARRPAVHGDCRQSASQGGLWLQRSARERASRMGSALASSGIRAQEKRASSVVTRTVLPTLALVTLALACKTSQEAKVGTSAGSGGGATSAAGGSANSGTQNA